MWTAAGVSALLIVAVGVYLTLSPVGVARRFGAERLVPWCASFAILRTIAAATSALTACLLVTARFHSGQPPWGRSTVAWVSAVSVPLLYPPVAGLCMSAAVATTYLALGLGPSSFFEFANVNDVAYGLLSAVIYGGIPALWCIAGAGVHSSPRLRIGSKLLATSMFVLVVFVALRVVVSIIGPAESSGIIPRPAALAPMF